jgi:AraC-like DNA-binding protein
MKKAIQFNNKVFFSWIISYTLILLIPIIISVTVYIEAYHIVENQIKDYNQSILEKTKSKMDNKLQELNNFSVKISLDPNISYLLDLRTEQESYSTFNRVSKLFSFNKNVNIYSPSNFIVKDCYIFLSNSNLVWTGSNLYNKKLFMDADISNGRITLKQWDEFSRPVDSIYVTDYYIRNGNKVVAIIHPLPLEPVKKKGNIVYLLEEDIFANISGISSLNQGGLYVVDQDGKVLFTSVRGSSLNQISFGDNFDDDSGILEWNIEGEDVVVVYTQSDIYPWRYVSVIPKSIFRQQSANLLKIIIFGIGLCLLLGFFAITILLNKNYNPVREIINVIKGAFLDKFGEYNNEFQLIKDSIVDIYQENESISQKIDQQNNAIRFNYIGRLLRGSISFSDISEDMLNSMGIEFLSDHFIVIICYIEGSDTWLDKHPDLDKNGYSYFFDEWILKKLRAYLGENYLIYQSEVGSLPVCLINIADEECKGYKQKLLRGLSDISQDIQNRIELDCSFAISNLNKTIESIPAAYNQAMCAMEYKFLGSRKNIMFIDDLGETSSNTYNYTYTMEEEQKLINHIRMGEYDRALEIVNNVLDINQLDPDSNQTMVSINILRCIIYDLISTFIRALNQDKMLEEIRLFDENRIMEMTSGGKSAAEMRKELITILKYICNEVVKYREKNDESYLLKKVDSIIENYFKNDDLNVSFISEKVGLNSKYLSTIYKGARGESIINTIHKRRIQEVKKLLVQKDISVGEAAKQVGFSNTNTFIRVFKKHEGITPGQFRELN